MYANDIIDGTTAVDATPEIVKETPATALVDAKNVLGPVRMVLKTNYVSKILISFLFSVLNGQYIPNHPPS